MLKVTWGEPKEEPIKLLHKGPSEALYHKFADVLEGRISGNELMETIFNGSTLCIYGGVLGNLHETRLQTAVMNFHGICATPVECTLLSAGTPTWFQLKSNIRPDYYFIDTAGGYNSTASLQTYPDGYLSMSHRLIIGSFRISF